MIKQIWGIVGSKNAKENYSLKNCSSFGIGGNAKYFATPETVDGLFSLIDLANRVNLRYKIIGNGTNLLFLDSGFNGLIISTKKLNTLKVVGDGIILASCGVSLSRLMKLSKEENLSGLEFAVGIPGTVGGALVMNAGAGEGDMSSITKSVTVIENGDIRTLEKKDLKFGYRTSYFLTHPNTIILFAELELKRGISRQEIEDKMEQNLTRRLASQPKERSAGCVFKKCGEFPAGLLIDEAGLKGLTIGGAKVSEVHANFIVNKGNATAKDVVKLIKIIKRKVWDKSSLDLELEIEIIK